MSVRSFIHDGSHFGKLGERKVPTFGMIQLFDIGEPASVGALYEDGSRQAQPTQWHGAEIMKSLTKSAKNPRRNSQQLKSDSRPRLESLGEALRRLATRNDFVMPKRVERDHAPPTPGQVAARQEFAKQARKHRSVEPIEIPKGAEDKLRTALKSFGPCKGIRILVATFAAMNKTSVIAVAAKVGINKSTAGVQFAEQKRDPKSVADLSKAKGKKAPAAKAAEPAPKKHKSKKGKGRKK